MDGLGIVRFPFEMRRIPNVDLIRFQSEILDLGET